MYTVCMLAGINTECKLRETKGCQSGLEPGLPLLMSCQCSSHSTWHWVGANCKPYVYVHVRVLTSTGSDGSTNYSMHDTSSCTVAQVQAQADIVIPLLKAYSSFSVKYA